MPLLMYLWCVKVCKVQAISQSYPTLTRPTPSAFSGLPCTCAHPFCILQVSFLGPVRSSLPLYATSHSGTDVWRAYLAPHLQAFCLLIFKLVCQSLVPAGTTIPGKKNYIFTPLTFFLLLTLQLGMDSLSCPLDQSVHCSREAVSFHCHPCPVSSNSPTNLRWRMGAPGKNA